MSLSSKKAYKRTWQLFLSQYPGQHTLPISVLDLCNFIGYLFGKNYCPSTIHSHVSALSYVHKFMGIEDPTASFIVTKMLKGCENLRKSVDTRLPITKTILEKLIAALDLCIKEFAVRILLKAIFLLAFHAFLRLGEILVRSSEDFGKVVQVQDVSFQIQNGVPTSVDLVLRHFKNIRNNQPVTISIETNRTNPQFCPVAILVTYLKHFNHLSGPLFQFQNGQPVPHNYVSKQLANVLTFVGINSKQYSGHSFRIGAATHATNLGFSEQYIRKMGRWHSNAVQKYIRISKFHL